MPRLRAVRAEPKAKPNGKDVPMKVKGFFAVGCDDGSVLRRIGCCRSRRSSTPSGSCQSQHSFRLAYGVFTKQPNPRRDQSVPVARLSCPSYGFLW